MKYWPSTPTWQFTSLRSLAMFLTSSEKAYNRPGYQTDNRTRYRGRLAQPSLWSQIKFFSIVTYFRSSRVPIEQHIQFYLYSMHWGCFPVTCICPRPLHTHSNLSVKKHAPNLSLHSKGITPVAQKSILRVVGSEDKEWGLTRSRYADACVALALVIICPRIGVQPNLT